MATRLYFHHQLTDLPGTFPETQQSTLTADVVANPAFDVYPIFDKDEQVINRIMNPTISISVFDAESWCYGQPLSVPGKCIAYFTRFVSPLLNQTSIPAGRWTFAFGTEMANPYGNFPTSGPNQSVWIHCYVWRPSDGTKLGTMLDGYSAPTVDLPPTTTAGIYSHVTTFDGKAVSGLRPADAVIIFEVWSITVAGPETTFGSNMFSYDGNVVPTKNASGISPASYLESEQDLSLILTPVKFGEPFLQITDITDNVTRTVTRTPRQSVINEANTINDSLTLRTDANPYNKQLSTTEDTLITNSVSHLLTRAVPLNIQSVPFPEDISISDSAECMATSGRIIHTGDPEYVMT